MGSSLPINPKPEVTRVTRLYLLDAKKHDGSLETCQKPVITWTGPIKELFGYAPGEINDTEEWWSDRIHADDRSDVLESLVRHLAPAPKTPFASESRIWGLDYRFRLADRSYLLVSDRTITTRDADGNAVCLESVIFDKEARRNERTNHAKILESQNHLALVANNTPSAVFMMDPQGYCVFMNNAAEQITGFTFQEIYDYTFHASVHSCRPNGDPFPLHECPVFGHQQEGTAANNEPETFIHKDGHHYDIEYSVSPIGNYASGGAVIEFRDVTEQKRIERERLNAILITEQQSVRIKADDIHKANMTSFVSFVCHELRNPLQGVTSSAEFLLETLQKLDMLSVELSAVPSGPHLVSVPNTIKDLTLDSLPNGKTSAISRHLPSGKEVSKAFDISTVVEMQGLLSTAKQLIGNIQTCADHQSLIINNVLDLSRLDAGKVEPFTEVIDINALGEQVVVMMSAKARAKHLTLTTAKTISFPLYLKADATILRQILLNLVSNAIKFTPERGTITVDVYADSPNNLGKVILHGSVTDNGLGMTEAEKRRLFQRFSQANRKVAQLYGGSGLGLSISKELVRIIGGEMHVESEPGEGSIFSFTSLLDPPTQPELENFQKRYHLANAHLAAGTPGHLESAAVNGTLSTVAPKFRMIGVAEDNPINLQYLARNLSKLGYQTTLCTNGREILEKFCMPNSVIDCCILDMSMPVMDGLEAASLMRQFEASQDPPQRTPMIALSGNALMEQVSNALSAGISDYLIKPCKQADLAKTLQYWEQIVHTGGEHKPMITKQYIPTLSRQSTTAP